MRTAVISDIHSNLEALSRVLDRIDQLGVDRIVCLGDIVGYGPRPNECIDLVRKRCASVIKGNHDAGAVGELPLEHFNVNGRSAIRWTRDQLSPQNADFLRGLTLLRVLDDMTLTHATPTDPESWDYVVSRPAIRKCFNHFTTSICFIGHTHTPLIAGEDGKINAFKAGMRYLINPGSVGQPRDGNPRASFGLLDDESWKFEIVRVTYNTDATASAIRNAGLPDALGKRLLHGI
jgi:predicted phosphodiesterase